MWVQISAGQGPAACCWVVAQVYKALITEAQSQGCTLTELDAVLGDEKQTFRSVLLHVEGAGEGDTTWLNSWFGSILWIGRSPYRPNHKRKNWFVGVTGVEEPQKHQINPHELRWECIRASGPGGQHVNTSSTAVRVTHIPSGLQAKAQEERSQHRNKSLALARLMSVIQEKDIQAQNTHQKKLWKEHLSLTRGDAIRVYKGMSFQRLEK